MRRSFPRFAAAIAIFALASCGQASGPPLSPASQPAASGRTCYVTKISNTTVTATITFYGWPDNDPPGKAIAHPVIHQLAGGDGTYCNPTTFATERANNKTIPYGTKIYVPISQAIFRSRGRLRAIRAAGRERKQRLLQACGSTYGSAATANRIRMPSSTAKTR